MTFIRNMILGLLVAILIHVWLIGWDEWKASITPKIEELNLEYWGSEQLHPSGQSAREAEHSLDQTDEAANVGAVTESIPTTEEAPSQQSSAERSSVNQTQSEQYHLSIEHNESDSTQLQIGMEDSQLISILGNPNRKDPSAYGYEWWIYHQHEESYIQVGVEDGQVVTIYTNAPMWNVSHLTPGMEKEAWNKEVDVSQEVSFSYGGGHYTFTLSEDDLEQRPLIHKGDIYIQLYVDIHHQHHISGIRLMNKETLLLHRPYTLSYIGSLPEPNALSAEEWLMVEKAKEKQIFDLVNVTRTRFLLPLLTWDDEVAVVAKGHSKDMLEQAFFSHVSPTYGDLGQRLEQADVYFLAAGENIAFRYVDGIAAHEGWLNSKGHRENIMKADYSHLGVGVKRKYYTQNFILK